MERRKLKKIMPLINRCYENIKKMNENGLRSKMAVIDICKQSYVSFSLLVGKLTQEMYVIFVTRSII